jgi:hypothetical protein
VAERDKAQTIAPSLMVLDAPVAPADMAEKWFTRLILHQRDNLEDTARIQGRTALAVWDEAVNRAEAAPDGSGAAD